MERILIVRSAANKVNPNNYNLQEIGLAKSFAKKGISCDIVYSNLKEKSYEENIYKQGNIEVNILWTKFKFKVLNNAIYTELMKKDIYEKYDLVVLTEYTQVMSYILSRIIKNKIIIYHGPYKDNKKLIQNIYDKILLPKIRRNISKIFTKSYLAEEYIRGKGFKDVKTIGVGLNIENIESNYERDYSDIIRDVKEKINNRRVLLYIGVLEERRNIRFLLDVLKKLLEKRKDVVLIIIGKGNEEEEIKYMEHIKNLQLDNNVIRYKKIAQECLKEIHKLTDIFLLPTKYEIFGMVILESMFLGTPVITTMNGGSSMLIEDEKTGYIIEAFDVEKWSNKINFLLDNPEIMNRISKEAKSKIVNEFTWDKVSERLIENINK